MPAGENLNTTLLLIGGLTALLLGGEGLVRGAVGLARHWRVPPLLIGLTIVSIGTSAPELTVSLMATAESHGDIALGNVIGSNICNIGLILGLVAIYRPLDIQRRLVVREVPILMVATALVLVVLSDRRISPLEGNALLFALMIYFALAFRGGRRLEVPDAALPGATLLAPHPVVSGLLLVGGSGGLYFGGEWVVAGAIDLAQAVGMSEAVIGITVIAIGTSLPELVASMMALRSNEADLAVGNVVGSNLFNLLGILGAGSAVYGLQMEQVKWIDLGFMAGLTVLLFPMVVTARKLVRWEGAGLLVAYVGYMAYLLIR